MHNGLKRCLGFDLHLLGDVPVAQRVEYTDGPGRLQIEDIAAVASQISNELATFEGQRRVTGEPIQAVNHGVAYPGESQVNPVERVTVQVTSHSHGSHCIRGAATAPYEPRHHVAGFG